MKKSAQLFLLVVAGLLCSTTLFGETTDPAVMTEVAKISTGGWIAISSALAIGIAAFGGALGQGRAAAAALEGISRNPGSKSAVFVPMILGLALIESLVIYALVIAFMLLTKI